MWSTKSIHGSTNSTYLLTGGTCTYTWFRKPYWNYITSVVLFSFHSSPLARTKQQETAYLLNIRNTTRVTFSIAMHHLMLKVWQVCPWSFESWGSGSGMGQTSWHIWDIFLVSVVFSNKHVFMGMGYYLYFSRWSWMSHHFDKEWQNNHLWARWIELQTYTNSPYPNSPGIWVFVRYEICTNF